MAQLACEADVTTLSVSKLYWWFAAAAACLSAALIVVAPAAQAPSDRTLRLAAAIALALLAYRQVRLIRSRLVLAGSTLILERGSKRVWTCDLTSFHQIAIERQVEWFDPRWPQPHHYRMRLISSDARTDGPDLTRFWRRRSQLSNEIPEDFRTFALAVAHSGGLRLIDDSKLLRASNEERPLP